MLRWLNVLGFGQRRCVHCGVPYFPGDLPREPITETLCPSCLGALLPSPRQHLCRGCGLPLTDPARLHHRPPICSACEAQGIPWRGIAYHGLYAGALRDLILRLKFDGQLYLTATLGNFLHNASACLSRPDGIVPIAQYPGRLRQRGYNQAHEIARAVASQSGLSFMPQLLRRVSAGIAQEGLTAAQRRANLEKAFVSHAAATGLHLWLIDDVFTSGSTARSATKALLHAGAASVQLLFLARTNYS